MPLNKFAHRKPKLCKPVSKHPDKYPQEEIFARNVKNRSTYRTLNLKQFPLRDWLFCHEVTRDGNASDAARRVGFSEAVAINASAKWLCAKRENSEKPHIWDLVHEIMAERLDKCEVDSNRIIREWAAIAFMDPVHIFDSQYMLKDLDQIPEQARHAIAGIEVTASKDGGTVRKVKFHGKMDALNSLARFRNMFADDNKQNWEGTLHVDLENMPTGDLKLAFMAELKNLPPEFQEAFNEIVTADPDEKAVKELPEVIVSRETEQEAWGDEP